MNKEHFSKDVTFSKILPVRTFMYYKLRLGTNHSEWLLTAIKVVSDI